MRVLTVVLVAFFAVLRPLPSLAQSPEDLVRWIYQSYSAEGVVGPRGFAYLATPTQRRTFLSGRMAAFFDANDTYGNDLAQACIDFAFDIPGQDYDADEILRTLNITSQRDQGKMDVAAEFMTFNTPAKIVYTFRVEDGVWRIDDVTGPGWRVSDIPCTPKFGTLAPTEDAASQFCYRTETDELRLTLRPDGQARFRFESWQANGHHCGGSGGALPVQGAGNSYPRLASKDVN